MVQDAYARMLQSGGAVVATRGMAIAEVSAWSLAMHHCLQKTTDNDITCFGNNQCCCGLPWDITSLIIQSNHGIFSKTIKLLTATDSVL